MKLRPRCERCDESALLNFIDFIYQTVGPEKIAKALEPMDDSRKEH
jgi:hypothetical protein